MSVPSENEIFILKTAKVQKNVEIKRKRKKCFLKHAPICEYCSQAKHPKCCIKGSQRIICAVIVSGKVYSLLISILNKKMWSIAQVNILIKKHTNNVLLLHFH